MNVVRPHVSGLDAASRTLWIRLGTFESSFGVALVGDVCSGGGVTRRALTRHIRGLLEQGVLEPNGIHRYRLSDSARQVARSELEQTGQYPGQRDKHLAAFLALALRAELEWRGPRQAAWLLTIERSIEDFRAAFSWSWVREPSSGLRLASALWFYWLLRGGAAEGRALLEQGLSANVGESEVLSRALNESGWLAYATGDAQAGQARLEDSLRIARELGDGRLTAHALTRLGVTHASRREVAAPLIQEALSISRASGDRVGTYFALHELAQLAYGGAEYPEARRLHEEALILKREQGDKWHIAFSAYWLAILDRRDGDAASAEQHLVECWRIRQELGERRGMAMCVEVLAWLASDRSEYDVAARLLGAAESFRAEVGATLGGAQIGDHAAAETLVKGHLGLNAYHVEFENGRLMTPKETIVVAVRHRIRGLEP